MTNQTNQTQGTNNNQNTQTKGEVKVMKTVEIKGFRAYKVEGQKIPASFMLHVLDNGVKKQEVLFGHSNVGGQQTYVAVGQNAPIRMKSQELLNRLTSWGVADLAPVKEAIGQLRVIRKKDYVVGTCSCGGNATADVTDFVQRNHAKMGVSEFSVLCYDCSSKLFKGAKSTPASSRPATEKEVADHKAKQEEKKAAQPEVLRVQKSAWDKAMARIAELEAVAKRYEEMAHDTLVEVNELRVENAELKELLANPTVSTEEQELVELASIWGALVSAQEEALAKKAERSEAVEQHNAAKQHNVESSQEQHNVEDKHNAENEHIIVCSKCGQEGHKDARSPLCPSRKNRHKSDEVESHQESGKEAERSEAPATQVEESPTAEAVLPVDTQEAPELEIGQVMDDCFVCEEFFPAEQISQATGCCPNCHSGVLALGRQLDNTPAEADYSFEVSEGSTVSVQDGAKTYMCLGCFNKVSKLDSVSGMCTSCNK